MNTHQVIRQLKSKTVESVTLELTPEQSQVIAAAFGALDPRRGFDGMAERVLVDNVGWVITSDRSGLTLSFRVTRWTK